MNISIRHLIRTALTGTIASITHFYQHESHTIWMVVSALFIIQIPESQSRMNVFKTAIDRIIATGIGVFLGLLGYGLIFLNIRDGNLELSIIIIFATFILTDLCQQITNNLTIINVTAAIIMLLSIENSSAFEHALERSLDIIIGAIIGLCATILIPPRRITN